MRRTMNKDFRWPRVADEYISLYRCAAACEHGVRPRCYFAIDAAGERA
jgi:hypothetical protein